MTPDPPTARLSDPVVNEPLVEAITDALTGYFDFGYGEDHAEFEAAWSIGEHIGKHRPDYILVPATAVPDAEVIQSILDLWAFADDRDVDDTTKDAQVRVRRYLENLPAEMQP